MLSQATKFVLVKALMVALTNDPVPFLRREPSIVSTSLPTIRPTRTDVTEIPIG